MTIYYYIYTRKCDNICCYQDPDLNQTEFVIEQTPFWSGKDFLCYIYSQEPTLTNVLEANPGYSWIKKDTIAETTTWCNATIPHSEGEEFTNDGERVIDNRTREM